MKWSCGVAAVLFNGLYLSGSTLGIKLLLSRFYFTSVLSCHMERKTMILAALYAVLPLLGKYQLL